MTGVHGPIKSGNHEKSEKKLLVVTITPLISSNTS